MKLNIAQCRPSKRTASPRGVRRSARNSSSSACFSLTQKDKVGEVYTGALCLPVSTLPSPTKIGVILNRQGKTRQSKKLESANISSVSVQVFGEKQIVNQRSLKPESVDDSHLHRTGSLNVVNNGVLSRQSSITQQGSTMLTTQKSFTLNQEYAGLARQRSFKVELTTESCISRQTSLKIEALMEPRVLTRTSSCTTIGRKRVVGVDDLSHEIDFPDLDRPSSPPRIWEPDSPSRKKFASPRTPSTCLDRSPSASLTVAELERSRWNSTVPQSPSTPLFHSTFCLYLVDEEYGGDSQLEELPFDLLLRIVCCLKHDDLHPVSLVCKRLMKAVSIAQRCHFSFTTPQIEKKGKSAQLYLSDDEQLTGKGGLAGTFIRPPTPNAPKHSSWPAELRWYQNETYPWSPAVVQLESPPIIQTRKFSRMTAGAVTHRVLFDEDELCEAVAQNML